MKRSNRKGFTIVELVIVIAIIAILAAVLIPTFGSIINKANASKDTVLVRNLNTALSLDKASQITHKYPQQALDCVGDSGFSILSIKSSANGNEILWDSANDLFCYADASGNIKYIPEFSPATTPGDEAYFKIYQISEQKDNSGTLDLTEDKYSAYLDANDAITKVVTNKGVDTGKCDNIAEVDYTNSSEKNVIIRTGSFATTLKINAHYDTVEHYGFASVVDIADIKSTSYHEHGTVGKLKIAAGHAVVEEDGTVYGAIDLDGNGTGASIENNGKIYGSKTEDDNCSGTYHTLALLVVDSGHVYEVCTRCGKLEQVDTFNDVDWSSVDPENAIFQNYDHVNIFGDEDRTGTEILNDDIPVYTWCQINEVAKSYIDNVTYTATGPSLMTDYCNIQTTYNKQRSFGCTIDLVAGMLTVTDNDTGNSYTETVNAGPYTFYNITPGVGGEFVVKDTNNNILQQGHLRPTGALRMIYTEGTWNARDLGGWACDGGTIKYNMLIRGGNPIGLTEWDKNTWVKLIGIDNDLFLAEDANYPTDSSPIGPNVTFQRTTLLNELTGGYETWESARLNGKATLIFNNLLDNAIAGKTTYFHCLAAADRTGMTAYVVEAILGMHESDIDKDYELTSFYTTTSPRTRKNTYVQFLDARYDGENLRDKAVNYMLECGISIEKINAFRNAVIDGNPEQLYDLDESKRINIATTFTNCSVSNSVGSQFVRNNSPAYASTSNTMNAVYGETYTLSLSNEANVNSLGVTQLVFYDDDGTITEITSNTTLYKGDTIRYKTKNSNTTHVAIRSHGDVEAHNSYITFRGPAYVEQSLPAPVDNIKHLTLNLTNCTSNATTTDLTKYEAFSLDLTPSSGYCFAEGGITVTMGGVDITSTALSGTHISIDSVTSNVVVTANAIQEGYSSVISSITRNNNLADPTSDDWKNNSRGSNSSEISTSSGNILTNKISVENGDVIFVKGLTMNNSGVLFSLLYTTTHNTFLPESDTTFISDFGTSGEWKYFTINTTGATGLRICATTPSNIGNVVICVYRDGNLVDSTSLVVDPLTAATTTIGNTTSSNNFARPNAINWDSDSGYGSTKGVYYNNVTGYTTTNYIPAQSGDIIFVKGMTFDAANGHGRSELFNSSMDPLAWTYILANNNNGELSEVGSTGEWVYFTINDSNSSYIRLSGHVANAENVSICVYRNGNWLVAPEQPILDPLNSAISAIKNATPSNNFADINGDDWHINSGYGSTPGYYYRDVTGFTTTNFISVQKGDVVLVKGMAFESATSIGHARSEVFNSSKTGLGWTYIVDGSTNNNNKIKNVGSSGDWVYYIVDDNSTAYIRMCGQVANVGNVAICVYRPSVGLLTVQ
ncbi:MAG: tyrosine-protein phosphatase [Clostridia bacterium]|nr:tyrosine-protein phosphatase [Clostridia bacterium]